jgi:putative transposase
LLWSLVYLVVRNLFALVWLLARPRRSNELEMLVLRHELAVLRRQAARPKLSHADRALLAALSRSVPRAAWPSFPVKPERLLRWHRELVARRWTYPHRAPGRPPLDSSLRTLILRLARDKPHWGYRRIVGEHKGVGIAVSATSVRKVLLEAGLQPAPERGPSSWRAFLHTQAASMLACDFLSVDTAFLQRIYVLFFISLATRRIEYIACTPNPDGRWVAQQARNFVMQLGEQQPFRFLVHDRDSKRRPPKTRTALASSQPSFSIVSGSASCWARYSSTSSFSVSVLPTPFCRRRRSSARSSASAASRSEEKPPRCNRVEPGPPVRYRYAHTGLPSTARFLSSKT